MEQHGAIPKTLILKQLCEKSEKHDWKGTDSIPQHLSALKQSLQTSAVKSQFETCPFTIDKILMGENSILISPFQMIV
jgi:hypothetical protein